MFENPRRGRQARNFTTNVPKILDLKSSSEQIFSENCRWVPRLNELSSYDTESTEVGGKQSQLYRDRRTVKNNATPNLSEFANRLKDLEERYNLNSAIRYESRFSITWAMLNVGYVSLF